MKRNQAVLRTFIFFLALFLPTLIWRILGAFGAREALDFDTNENRNKHVMAEDLSPANLTSELEATYNDSVPFRSVMLTVDKKLDEIIEAPYDHGIEPAILALVNDGGNNEGEQAVVAEEYSGDEESLSAQYGDSHVHAFELIEHMDADYENYGYNLYRCYCGEEKKEILDKPVDDSYLPYKNDNDQVVEGRYGWMFFDEELADYQGTNLPNEDELQTYADLLERIDQQCGANGTEFYGIAFPNKSSVYAEYMPSITHSEDSRIRRITDYIRENTSVPFSYTIEEHMYEKLFHQLYFKTDTHWNYYGAAAGLNVLYEKLGKPLIDPDTLQKKTVGQLGDLEKMLGFNDEEPVDELIYRPEINIQAVAETDDGKSGFFEYGIAEFTSDAQDDRTIVMIGDSYIGFWFDMVSRDFAHSVFINSGYLQEMDASIFKNCDILVVELVERNSADWVNTLQILAQMMEN